MKFEIEQLINGEWIPLHQFMFRSAAEVALSKLQIAHRRVHYRIIQIRD